MMRFVRVQTWLVAFVLMGAAGASAQTSTEPKFYAEFTVAATLGHKSDTSVGGEAGYRLSDSIDAFMEATRMFNVGTSDLDARAQKIADAVGATVGSTAHKVTMVNFGLRYRFTTPNRWH